MLADAQHIPKPLVSTLSSAPGGSSGSPPLQGEAQRKKERGVGVQKFMNWSDGGGVVCLLRSPAYGVLPSYPATKF